jgi:hypothetical protein
MDMNEAEGALAGALEAIFSAGRMDGSTFASWMVGCIPPFIVNPGHSVRENAMNWPQGLNFPHPDADTPGVLGHNE